MRFPSPQGGSETSHSMNIASKCMTFPSPQGGSETERLPQEDELRSAVSIPSRRVGDRRSVRRSVHRSSLFPSPQGGSETCRTLGQSLCCAAVSIPSRRVGDERKAERLLRVMMVSIPSRRVGDFRACCTSVQPHSFHPLKAGRRLKQLIAELVELSRFHPLKAGRRRRLKGFVVRLVKVSIPSRRVGDVKNNPKLVKFLKFPSPQGGSETLVRHFLRPPYQSFHPLKAGRRLGPNSSCYKTRTGFHPLKAGRRQIAETAKTAKVKKVSIPSRRVGDAVVGFGLVVSFRVSIPSRRVGDRSGVGLPVIGLVFPSPQGGSETAVKAFRKFST